MPRGRKKQVVEAVSPATTASLSIVPSIPIETDKAMMDLEKALMVDYKDYMSGNIPNRSNDLFKMHIPSLNWALNGGLPRGQMVHLYGPEGAGKTTLALHIVADIQKQGGRVLYIDAENSLDLNYAKAIGVNPSTLRYVNNILGGEWALDMIEKGIRGNIYSLIVVDTVASLVPKAMEEAPMDQLFVAAQARMMSHALLKLNNAAVNTNAIILWVNQERSNIAPVLIRPI